MGDAADHVQGLDRRLADFLLAEAERTGSDTIRMTHEQIAQHISSARRGGGTDAQKLFGGRAGGAKTRRDHAAGYRWTPSSKIKMRLYNKIRCSKSTGFYQCNLVTEKYFVLRYDKATIKKRGGEHENQAQSRSGDCQYHPGRTQAHRRILPPAAGERTEATKCMCQEFKNQIADPGFEGFCHCMFSITNPCRIKGGKLCCQRNWLPFAS